MMIERIGDNSILVSLDENIYPEQVIFKCFYWYGNNYNVDINKKSSIYNVTLSTDRLLSEELYQGLKKRILRDLIDYKTRQIVFEETHLIKEILIAKAFSALDQYDERPRGNLSDYISLKDE